jgi:hypothetical protein
LILATHRRSKIMERFVLPLRPVVLLLLLLVAVPLVGGCSGDNGSGGVVIPPGENPEEVGGNVRIFLTDAVPGDLSGIFLTIDAIELHPAGSPPEQWTTIVPNSKVATPLTINVLALRNGAKADLGVASVRAGEFDSMRIRFSDTPEEVEPSPEVPEPVQHPAANFVFLDDKNWEPLLFPSGLQHPVRLDESLVIRDDRVSRLLLHLDLERSVLQVVGGPWVVRPQISAGELPDLATIRGRVFEETDEGPQPLSGVLVTAQRLDDEAPEGLRVVQTTISSGPGEAEPGTFVLEGLEPGVFRIVFFKRPFGVRALEVAAPEVGVFPGNDMTLSPEEFRHVDGVVGLEPFEPGASVDVRLVRNVPPDNLRVIVLTQHPAPAQEGTEGPMRYDMDVPQERYDFFWSAQGYNWVRDTFTVSGNTHLPPVLLVGQEGGN